MSNLALTMTTMLRDRCGSTSSAESSSLSSQPSSPPDMGSLDDPRRLRQSNSSRYKTELCRAFEEYGTCKYGEKCQFAHGMTELRSLCRHPKYKTELCRTFHTEGFCPYGKRCHFVHTPKDEMVNLGNDMKLSPLEMPGDAIYLDNFHSPPHMSHLPSPPAPRLEYFDTLSRGKSELFIFQQELPLQFQDMKRQYATLQQQQQESYRQVSNSNMGQWEAAQALRNALNEVAKSRLPVFSGLGTT